MIAASEYIADMAAGFLVSRRFGVHVPSILFTITITPLVVIVAMLAAPAFSREASGAASVIIESLLYSLIPMTCSALAASLVVRYNRSEGLGSKPHRGFATSVVAALLTGLVLGAAGIPAPTQLVNPLLLLLVFLAGMELGAHREVRFDPRLVLIPFASLSGSLAAGLALDALTGVTPAVAAGMGWYTFTGPYLYTASSDPRLAAIGFLANLLREQLTILIVPLAAHRLPLPAAVALGGATTMDTTLPVYTASYGPRGALAAATNGIILTILVPILVPLVYTLLPS